VRDFVRDFTSTFRKVYKGEREVYGEGGRETMKVFVLEVGRPVRADVEREFGHIDEIVSVPRAISELEIPRIAAEAYHKIMKLASGGEEVAVVLSGPLGLAFELGQAIGLAHAKVIVYQFSQGRYVRVPPLTREHLFLAQGVR
jgi:hypothetical protein